MTSGSATEFQELRGGYDAAFRNWSRASRSGGDTVCAERLYRHYRGTLARFILKLDVGRQSTVVQRVAHSLWERGGRSPGTAESDWFRAEALVNGFGLEHLCPSHP